MQSYLTALAQMCSLISEGSKDNTKIEQLDKKKLSINFGVEDNKDTIRIEKLTQNNIIVSLLIKGKLNDKLKSKIKDLTQTTKAPTVNKKNSKEPNIKTTTIKTTVERPQEPNGETNIETTVKWNNLFIPLLFKLKYFKIRPD